MTPAELDRFRTLLEQERADLQARIAGLREQVGGVAVDTDEPSDEGDQASDMISVEENSAQINLLRATLAQVEKALGCRAAVIFEDCLFAGRAVNTEVFVDIPVQGWITGGPAFDLRTDQVNNS